MREAYLTRFKAATSAEDRTRLNNTKIIINDPEVRKKYDEFLVRRGLDDGIVAGLVPVVDDGGAGGIYEAGNNLPQRVETAPVAKKIKQILCELDGDNEVVQAEDLTEFE